MSNLLKADIGVEDIMSQNEELDKTAFAKKVTYDAKNYLDTKLSKGQTEKTLVIRLLPFSPEGGSPFHKIYMHTVRVNKEFAASGWKIFACPKHNGHNKPCPFCELQEQTKALMENEHDEAKKKQYSSIEFANRAREFWVVRCIDRAREEDGVKFWVFPHSKKNDGIYNKIFNIFKRRSEQAIKRGKQMNIFSLENGKDLEVTITKDSNGKNVYTIVDSDEISPLSTNIDLANEWISDEKKWDDVYTIKDYNYLSVILEGKVPFFDKEKGCYVAKKDIAEYLAEKQEKEDAAISEFEQSLPQSVKNIENGFVEDIAETIQQEEKATANDDDEDLPF